MMVNQFSKTSTTTTTNHFQSKLLKQYLSLLKRTKRTHEKDIENLDEVVEIHMKKGEV